MVDGVVVVDDEAAQSRRRKKKCTMTELQMWTICTLRMSEGAIGDESIDFAKTGGSPFSTHRFCQNRVAV